MRRTLAGVAVLSVLAMTTTVSCRSPSRPGADARGDAAPTDVDDARADSAANDAGMGGIADRPTLLRLSENGQSCRLGDDCHSGACVDEVCCDTACNSVCTSCVVPGSVGVCLPAEVGTDPRGECPDEGVTSCGRDGTCDGAGACQHYPAGTACQAPTCSGTILNVARRCDGRGACLPKIDSSCEPFACGTDGRCLSTCADDRECSAGQLCVAGSCGKKPLGASCDQPDACHSGFCSQGVCCASECPGGCWSCALTGSVGVCTPVPDGDDSEGGCLVDDPSLCGTDGRCDGIGGCRLYRPGTECGAPTCVGSGYRTRRTCNGAGRCEELPATSCGLYRCGGGSCFTACNSAADCLAPNQCSKGTCVPACPAQFNFENGTEQRWTPNQFAATALSRAVNDDTLAYCGQRSLKASADFGADSVGELFVLLPTATNFAGKTIVYRLYLDGPPLPAGTSAWGTLTNGPVYHPGPATTNLTVGTWNSVAYSPAVVGDRIGLRLSTPAGVSWKGTIYVDEVGW